MIGLLLLLSLPAFSQQNVVSGRAISAEKLPSDLRIPAVLKVTLSTKKSKVGDPVKLEVATDVHDGQGSVVIPRHAKLMGHVTRVVRFEKNKQWAMLSFLVDRAEWKDHTAVLDAPVYGADALATDALQAEMVDGLKTATLSLGDPLDIVNTEVMSDTRSGAIGGYAHAVRDSTFHTVIMQLTRVPDAVVRTSFIKKDGDLHVPNELMLVCLNGMKAQ
jgi:hypothetical protein